MTSSKRELIANAEVYSPRWGHPDTYTLTFSPEKLSIAHLAGKSCECTSRKGDDAVWTGYMQGVGHPLMKIFENDSIYAPSIVPFALEYAWGRWTDGDVTDEEMRAGITELFAWIDKTARSKPAGAFWSGGF